MKVLAEGIEQRGAWIERQPMLGFVDSQHDVERRECRLGALRGRRRRGPGQELSYRQSAAGDGGYFQQLSPCHIGAGHRLPLAFRRAGSAASQSTSLATNLIDANPHPRRGCLSRSRLLAIPPRYGLAWP